MTPTFSLAYTSVRPGNILAVVDAWRKTASGKHAIEVVIAVDGSDDKAALVARQVPDATVVIQAEAPFNCVRGWNKAAAATTGKVIIAIADDFKPCANWDDKLFTLKTGWMDDDWVAHTEDGYVHNLCVLAILTRVRYERFGYLFYPDYESIFCDTEFTEAAYQEGRVIDAKHILIEHLHPDCNKRPRDRHDAIHSSQDRWSRGEMLFNYRKHRKFPIDVRPKALGQSVVAKAVPTDPYAAYAAYIQANRNDFCLREVVKRLYDEGIRHFFFCIPDEYWSGKPTPQSDIDQVLEVALRIQCLGADIHHKKFNVAEYRFEGDTRIMVETRVRNDSLAWIRQNGFSNICVVDSDELWPVGMLAMIKSVVDTSNPQAISLPMIPVVGFPGYPIEGATDRAVAYVGHSCVFKDCRSPVGVTYFENRMVIYHFTSIRRTAEETIEKHRQSGHYDDPRYDFAWWIDNVLPNIKPGFQPKWPDGRTGIHMFKTYQIWPFIRNWTEADMAQIPESLHEYLGR